MEIVTDFVFFFCASKSLWTLSAAMKLKYACSLKEMLWPTWLLLLFSRSVVSNSLRPHELQYSRLPYTSLSPGACSNSCPLSQWCHPTISSSVIPLSSCLQSFPRSGSFSVSWLFASGGQSIGASASASVLPMNIQDWFSDKPRQHIKNQSHHCADKGPYSQSYRFSTSHIQMWELDPKEGWVLKNDAFKLWCWRRLLRAFWTGRRSNQSILKEINSDYSLEGLMRKLQYFAYLMWRADWLRRPWCWERLKAGR